MPLYEYECDRHGVFEAWAGMSRSSEPAPCPSCQSAAARILSAVRGAQLAAGEVRARDRNERSKHEPRIARAQRVARDPEVKPKLQRAHGSRPWALGH